MASAALRIRSLPLASQQSSCRGQNELVHHGCSSQSPPVNQSESVSAREEARCEIADATVEVLDDCQGGLSLNSRYSNVWVIVPVFNEDGVIGDVVQELRGVFANVVCVDDGSSDRSADVAQRAGAVVVRHAVNLGQGAALQTGFDFTVRARDMECVVTFDADGQHQVSDAEAMVTRLSEESLDALLGSRFLDRRTQASALKKAVLKLAVLHANATTGLRVTDAHNGLRVLSREVVSRMQITQNRMAHASELVAQLGTMTLQGRPVRYAEHPVHIIYSDYSMSKGQSIWNSVNILSDLMLK